MGSLKANYSLFLGKLYLNFSKELVRIQWKFSKIFNFQKCSRLVLWEYKMSCLNNQYMIFRRDDNLELLESFGTACICLHMIASGWTLCKTDNVSQWFSSAGVNSWPRLDFKFSSDQTYPRHPFKIISKSRDCEPFLLTLSKFEIQGQFVAFQGHLEIGSILYEAYGKYLISIKPYMIYVYSYVN